MPAAAVTTVLTSAAHTPINATAAPRAASRRDLRGTNVRAVDTRPEGASLAT